jgi:hypothetical protein
MNPSDFRSSVRARLFGLGDRGPKNLDDVVFFLEGKARSQGSVRTVDPRKHEPRELVFRNGLQLRFDVGFEKAENGWMVRNYSFHVSRNGTWFRYDLDPDAARGQKHPIAHLHVGEDEPRYPTQALDILALFDFLIAQDLV